MQKRYFTARTNGAVPLLSARMRAPHIVLFALRWPPVHASAAGVRTLALISALCRDRPAATVHVLTPAPLGPDAALSLTALREHLPVDAVLRFGVCDANAFWASDLPRPPRHARSLWAHARRAGATPDIVIYDTAVAEDMFGWQARAVWGHTPTHDAAEYDPGASQPACVKAVARAEGWRTPVAGGSPLHVLDMQDCAHLREHAHASLARRLAARCAHVAARTSADEVAAALARDVYRADREDLYELRADDVQACVRADTHTHMSRVALREWRAMLGCDVCVAISAEEAAYIARIAGSTAPEVQRRVLCVPLCARVRDGVGEHVSAGAEDADGTSSVLRPWSERSGAFTLGTFRHAPNVDSVKVAIRVWRRLLHEHTRTHTHTQLSRGVGSMVVYGSGAQHGWAAALKGVHGVAWGGYLPSLSGLQRHRVLVAPLRFGAGMKGKLIDARAQGCRVVTTSVGVQGFQDFGSAFWSGITVADDESSFVDALRTSLHHADAPDPWKPEMSIHAAHAVTDAASRVWAAVEGPRAPLGLMSALALAEGSMVWKSRWIAHKAAAARLS